MSLATWELLPFELAVRSRGSGNSGLPTKEWLPDGKFPVIGQGAEDIEGWTDREDLVLRPAPAVVLYGGHTRRVKHVSYPFVPGPNVKILEPVDAINPKFLYYFLLQLPVASKGYADHFPLVRKCDVPAPALAEQKRIVTLLDEAFTSLTTAKANAERNLQNARAIFESHLESIYSQPEEGWTEMRLGDLCQIKTGKKDVNQGNPEGEYPFFTCAASHTFSDSYSFDAEALLIAGNGNVGQVSYYSGKFEAYQRTYVLFDFKGVTGKYLFHALDKRLSATVAKQKLGNTMPYIKIGMLADFAVPIPPPKEQDHVTEGLGKIAAETQRLTHIYERKLAALEELKQSLLQQAFNGEL